MSWGRRHGEIVFSSSRLNGQGAEAMRLVFGVESYFMLLNYAHPAKGSAPLIMNELKTCCAHASPLIPFLVAGHQKVTLSQSEILTLVRWLDLNCVNYGDWPWNKNEFQVLDKSGELILRQALCEVYDGKLATDPIDALIVVQHPKKAGCFSLDLPKWRAVGLHLDRKSGRVNLIRAMWGLVDNCIIHQAFMDLAGTCGRGSRGGCLCGSCWVLEYRNAASQKIIPIAQEPPALPDLIKVAPELIEGRMHSELYCRK